MKTLFELDKIDFDAIPDRDDKLSECEFFLELASANQDVKAFRWLISAFLNASYSYFETSAVRSYYGFIDPDTDKPIEDEDALNILRRYIKINKSEKEKRPYYLTTSGLLEVTEELYKYRKENTHHFALSIMASGTNLPEDFHFGYRIGDGMPVLTFCREVIMLIRQVQQELEVK